MKPENSKALVQLLEDLAKLADKQFDSVELRRSIAEIGGVAGESMIARVSVAVEVFDKSQERSIGSRVARIFDCWHVGALQVRAKQVVRLSITSVGD